MAFALQASSISSVAAAVASSSFSSSAALLSLRRRHAARVSTRAVVAAPTAECRRVATGKRSVAETFTRLRDQGKTAFITAGDPDLATTSRALRILDYCGSDVIELGLPYSDPLVDGPVIQASASRALKKGTTLDSVMAMLKGVTPELSCPIVLFTYYNPILKRGVRNFMATVKQAGVHVPDVPLEETASLRNEALVHNIELVLLTTATTPTKRMEEITKASEGFVYLVSVNGVTGPRSSVNPRVKDLLQEIKQMLVSPRALDGHQLIYQGGKLYCIQ